MKLDKFLSKQWYVRYLLLDRKVNLASKLVQLNLIP